MPIAQRRITEDFGTDLALQGDTLLVGAPPHLQRQWRAHDGAIFGSSVAISGDVAVVGTDEFSEGGSAGRTYVFERGAKRLAGDARISFADASPFLPERSQDALALDGATLVAESSTGVRVFDLNAPGIPGVGHARRLPRRSGRRRGGGSTIRRRTA